MAHYWWKKACGWGLVIIWVCLYVYLFEWGYILLSELESLKLGNEIPIIERDRYLRENTTVHDECVRLGIREFEYG